MGPEAAQSSSPGILSYDLTLENAESRRTIELLRVMGVVVSWEDPLLMRMHLAIFFHVRPEGRPLTGLALSGL
uniref:Uncharacterized protein n=1 Tax=Anguilla anguilla TaxID=7936 RepID=A0A0E9WNR8_ANGAN